MRNKSGKIIYEHIPWTIMVMKTSLNAALDNQGHQSSILYLNWWLHISFSIFVCFISGNRHNLGIY